MTLPVDPDEDKHKAPPFPTSTPCPYRTGADVVRQESWKHIQQVAQEIHQQTGLQVVVTLGSSPQPTLVYFPGVHTGELGAAQNVAPIGWVEERWIHIGVGLTSLNQLGSTRLLLLGAVLAVCLGYLAVAFSALVSSQRREFAVLSFYVPGLR